MKYIFNANGKCVASCDYAPNLEDLASRGEVAVESETEYQLSEIELVAGVITPIIITETLDEAKARYTNAAGKEFARRRDAIRWVDGYGYDCQSEDVTNFMAAFTPLLVAGSGSVYYKVWLTETNKGVVERNYEQMQTVYNAVRSSQLDAYSWYEGIKAQIHAANTIEDLEMIFPLGGNE